VTELPENQSPESRSQVNWKAIKAAFPTTIPVLTGYLFLGTAYGILMNSKGYGVGWTFLMSLLVFAGSAQYVAITFLTTVFNPLYALLLTLLVNARHMFYGISMLDKYRGTGRLKSYLIFGLTDETFSINCATEAPAGVNRARFLFFVTLLDHLYWVGGSVLGGLLGPLLTLNTRGLDFVLTVLFVVIFISQWQSQKKHGPAIIGLGCSAICLWIFGPDKFIIPAMLAILATLTLGRKKLDEEAAS
jgi:4-azaleucine resistance transporter AzlC